ncbi:TIGR04282 family arsenosugar biosynthesis glycosyltransferase [Zunongwangia sp. F363]|uniref:TIGR04282 family arsenosugar biosynthesis glycosyltransferase n=1 Tax=Autumnicola tepida TaxID=3075595 RepID=A0ABU3C4T4_9FLAO|nr:TIGR04282 family arsenosugar biosynthesis glycosyltransferase [Zunongwangia sp. F363]MDT0641293.1 TIGR04282 family arsenosugar biosynthesis glycosyltransferase [Zunongwangia sp. F363]
MQENQQKNLLLIFTRNPELGKVKTRLAKDTGEQAALDIYKFLLEHTVSITKNLPVKKRVFYSEEISHHDVWEKQVFEKKLQQGKSLGERMQNAFREGFKDGFRKVIIIGSDLYDLEQQDLEQAFKKLEENDVVVGPAEDGGYYLLGMKSLNSDLFRNKMWGSNSVLQSTLEDLKNYQIKLLEERNDVDVLSDIIDHPAFQKFLNQPK